MEAGTKPQLSSPAVLTAAILDLNVIRSGIWLASQSVAATLLPKSSGLRVQAVGQDELPRRNHTCSNVVSTGYWWARQDSNL